MSLLRNPIVVGLLAVAAAALVFQRVVWPLMKHSGSQRQTPPVAAALSDLPPPTPAPATEKKAVEESAAGTMTGTGMELGTLERDSARWTQGGRDPFQRNLAATTNQAKAYPPAMQLLRLTGIWRQIGSTLAVVNDQVIAEGDGILAFTVQSIEDTRIWVTGPNGRETVEFGSHSAPPPETEKPGPRAASPGKTNQ